MEDRKVIREAIISKARAEYEALIEEIKKLPAERSFLKPMRLS